MGDAKDDDSTDIDSVVTKFIVDMSKSATELLKKGKPDPKNKNQPATIKFSLSRNKATRSRTPAEQAEEVAGNHSQVCWGAHMSDKARDVMMFVNGSKSDQPKKVFGDQFAEFKKEWAATMKKHGLLNFQAKDGWGEGDEFHLELPDARVARTDERAKACLQEYIRLTREGGKQPNAKFESDYKALLKPYIDAIDVKKKSTSG